MIETAEQAAAALADALSEPLIAEYFQGHRDKDMAFAEQVPEYSSDCNRITAAHDKLRGVLTFLNSVLDYPIVRCGDSRILLAVDREELAEAYEDAARKAVDTGNHMTGPLAGVDAILARLDLREVAEVIEGRYDGFLHEIRWDGERMHERHGRNIGHLLADFHDASDAGNHFTGGEDVAVAILKSAQTGKEGE